MGTYRKRFNEKARAGHMARLKELKRVRNKQFLREVDDEQEDKSEISDSTGTEVQDSNAVILQPMSAEEAALKKRKLEELFKPTESKVSRQKKKRLDKFIERQLKKEEKKVLIDKIQEFKIDTTLLTSSKRLGHGRQTKKEEFAEALSLEKQGRASDLIKDILYEEKITKDWDEGHGSFSGLQSDEEEEVDGSSESSDANTKTSTFIDRRPNNTQEKSSTASSGFGFGFSNVKVVNKKAPVKKFSWKQRLEAEEQRRANPEHLEDFDTSSEDEDGNTDINVEEEGGSNSENIDNEDEDSEMDESDSSGASEENSSEKDSDEKVSEKSQIESFRDWAKKNIEFDDGIQDNVDLSTPILKGYKPLVRQEDLEDDLVEPQLNVDDNLKRKTFFVEVERSDEIKLARSNLPVFQQEHMIMEAIHHNDVVIICGETGSGKTTQIPQFLYEAGYGSPDSPDTPGMIGITQPRRVAAVSMAERVSNELGNHSDKVAYQIRFDSNVKDDTRVKFMTDGVLLREMMHDFKLTKYSSIIIDEAHERNINTDILLGMLSRCAKLRATEHAKNPECKKLKLIIMSATLRVTDFSENSKLFRSPPPIINVQARQFPVSVHFNRRTPYDYAEEAFKKTCKIHRKLPPGAILIFMTGQQEIVHMVKRLRKEFPLNVKSEFRSKRSDEYVRVGIDAKNADLEAEDIEFSVDISDEQKFNDDLGVDDYEEHSDDEEGFEETSEEHQSDNDSLYVLPLYSLLPTKEQLKVFHKPPKNSRLCVVATNVAETSLTIPGVRYVVDCGRFKERKYNEENGVQSFEVGWTSKASADQRSGRAGRTGPGHCYRLYSSAVFERDFEMFSKPEVLRMPVESVVLQMKSMAIHNVVNFPFPTPPDHSSLTKATNLLRYLGALDEKGNITDDGKKMCLFPLSPRFSKILLLSNEQGCLPYIITIVSGLSVGDPFISEHELGISDAVLNNSIEQGDAPLRPNELEQRKALKTKFFKSRAKFSKIDKTSDIFKLLSAVAAMDYLKPDQRESFMKNHFLRAKVIEEIRKLRKQLLYIVKVNTSKESIAASVNEEELKCLLPNETQVKLLKQMICAGFIDCVAVRADQLYPEEAAVTNRTAIINIPYLPVLAQKQSEVEDMFVYIHPSSVLTASGEVPPKYMIYQSLNLNASSKTRMSLLCDVKSTPLANVARHGSLLTFGKPLTGQGLKAINISSSERYCYVVPRFGSSTDTDLKIGWDLNPVAVHQIKKDGQWKVEKFVTGKAYQGIEKQHKQ